MTPRERKDIPWVVGLGLLVAVAIIIGIVANWR